MNKKLIWIIICFIICIFISLAAVSAADDVDNKTLSESNDEILQTMENEELETAGSTGTFTDLNDLIVGANSNEIKLNQDYAYDETSDSSFVGGIKFTKSIIIDGQGHTISGSNKARIFAVGAHSNGHTPVDNVILKNINFVDAFDEDTKDKNSAFGAVEFYGNGSIINCNFTNNYAFCSAAIAIGYGTDITVTGCNFINNTGFGQGGGAIRLKTWVHGLTISDCLFENNYGGTYGGAVHSDMGKENQNCVVVNCIFKNNTAATGAGALFFETPGGVVKNSQFYDNSAPIGGAIYWNGVDGDVSTSKFVNNNATNGGAIYFSGRSTSNLTTSTFTDNYATENGGAVYFNGSAGSSIDECSFNHNIASGDGGAIYCIGEFFKLTNSNFTNDSATNGGSLYLDIGAYVFNSSFTKEHATNDGGAIYLYAKIKEGTTIPSDVKMGVYSSNFINCSAAHDGGAGYVYSDYGVVQDTILTDCTAGHDGGAGYIYGSYGKLINAQLINNMANHNGGALYWAGGYGVMTNTSSKRNIALGNGGALYWSGIEGNVSDSNFTINHAIGQITGPDINVGNGGSIMWIGSDGDIFNCQFNISTAKYNGGVAYISGDNTNITKSTFERYNATNGGALYIEGNNVNISESNFEYGESEYGGAIYLNGDNSYLGESNLTHNHAKTDGGIIYVNGNYGTIINSNLQYSYSEQSGGAVYVKGSYTIITNSNLTYNNASNANGGSIYINGSKTNISESLFQYCFARNGAAIYVGGSDAQILNSNFIQNGANPELNIQDTAGGSIYIQGNNTLVQNNNFTRNSAGTGGAIYITGSNTNITESKFEYTTSQGDGASIYVNGSNTNICNVKFEFTNAYGNGGAIYVGGKNTHICESVFQYNNATNGGAIYIAGENTDIMANFSYTFAKNGNGGAIYVTGDNNDISDSNFTITIAFNGNGGAIYAGGVNTTISNIQSDIAQAIRQGPGHVGNGGSVYIAGNASTITESKFLHFNATDNGGGLYVQGNNVNITKSIFEFGEATLGGGIYIEGNNTYLSQSNLTRNHARQNGGVIYIDGNGADISQSSLEYSYAGVSGGSIFIKGANNQISNSNLTYNNATNGFGGSIYIEGNNNNITNSLFEFGTSTKGGAIYINGDNTKISYSNFTQNGINPQLGIVNENAEGGTIYIAGNDAILTNDEFKMSQAYNGGIIYVSGDDAQIKNSNFTMSVAYNNGGAIYVAGNSALIDNSKFSLHNATKGGAVYIAGNDSGIINSQFTITTVNNTNDNSTAGGAIYVGGNSVNILKSAFNITRAQNGNGGAIFVSGNDTIIEDSNFTISLAIQGNGGAIYIAGENAQLNNLNSNVSQAIGSIRGSRYGPINYAGLGGTIYISGGNVTISESDFKRYNATFKGGSVYIEGDNVNISKSSFEFGEAEYGGSIYINGENTLLTDSVLSHNHAIVDGGVIYVNGNNSKLSGSIFEYSYANRNGGTIYINGENTALENSKLSFNNASTGYGGSIYVKGNNTNITNSMFQFSTSQKGGAIYINGTNTEILNSNFTQNKVISDVENADGGTIYIEGDKTLISESNFTMSTANDGGFIYISGDNANITKSSFDRSVGSNYGGAIYIGGENATISKSSFSHHNATYGGAIYVNGTNTRILTSNFTLCNAAVDGGAIYVSGHNASVVGCNITKYNATEQGGALYVEGDNVNITKSSFEFGEAEYGGAVFIQGENTYVAESVFTHNHAHQDGGIIYINGSNANLNTSILSFSYANNSGGAIYIEGLNTTVNNCNMSFNNATAGFGGSIYVKGNNTNITGSDFKFCTSTVGGAIYIDGMNASILTSNFTQNRVSDNHNDGGTIYVAGDNAKIAESNFKMSSAYNGGIIYIAGANTNITKSTFDSSVAYNYGGAIYVGGENASISESSFARHNATKGGGIYIDGNNTQIITSNFTLCNAAVDGGAIYVNGHNSTVIACQIDKFNATHYGGGLYVNGDNVNITKSSFEYGEALDGGAVFIQGENTYISESNFTHTHAKENGGVVYINGSNAKINNSNLKYSYSNVSGGAIYIEGVNATIANSNLTYNNASAGFGGSIYIKGDNTNITDSLFQFCTSTNGGAIYIYGMNSSIVNSEFMQNKVSIEKGNGGTIFIEGNVASVSHSNFTMSTAYDGGFIYIKGANTTIDYSNFLMSQAFNEGGAIYIGGANATIYKSNFTKHNATKNGGAIYVAGENVNISSSLFSNCNVASGSGGVIYIAGNGATIIDSELTYYNASSMGGGVYVKGNDVNITHSSFEFGEAEYGGAVYISGENTYVADSVFTHNHAKKDGGIIYVQGNNAQINTSILTLSYANNNGGAIYIKGANTTVNDCNMSFNNATTNDGGSIYINGPNTNITGSNFTFCAAKDGGSIYVNGVNTLIEESQFSQNMATTGNGGTVYIKGVNATIFKSNFTMSNANNGGFVYIDGSNSHIIDSNFIRSLANTRGGAIFINGINTTIDGSNFLQNNASYGGAVYVSGANANINGSDFEQGHASHDAGGVYLAGQNTIVFDSTFDSNSASNGGAMYNKGGTASILYSNFTNNLAYSNGLHYGGAIYWMGGSDNDVILGCLFVNNSAKSPDEDAKNAYGGAIYCDNANKPTQGSVIRDSMFINNYAGRHGGAINWGRSDNGIIDNCTFVNNTSRSDGAAIYAGHDNYDGQNLTVINCNFVSNYANIRGGAISLQFYGSHIINSNFTSNSGSEGGSIYVNNHKANNTEFVNCIFINSTTHEPKSNDGGSRNGGAAYIETPLINFINSTFINCSVGGEYDGGAIYFNKGSNGSMVFNCTIIYSSAGNGGGTYISALNIDIINSTFINNTVTKSGAGIFVNTIDIAISNSTFINNTANLDGGGVYSRQINTTLINSTFINNTANSTESTNGNGGAVYLSGENSTVYNSNFTNNTARNNGGAIYFVGNDGKIINVTFDKNSAGISGGAIYVSGNDLSIINTNFTSNVANIAGGALYIGGNNINLNKTIFKGNNASTGSAIYLAGNNLKVANTIFHPNQANADEILINVKDVNYYPNEVEIIVTFKGRDNIANAIWNEHGVENILLNNISYEMYKNGELFTFTSDNQYTNPVSGAENSNGEIYQDNRENAQKINIQIINKQTDEILLNLIGNYTDIYGNVTTTFRRLSPGNYTIKAEHLTDDYYTGLELTKDFEVENILNITKTPQSTGVDKDQLINYTITIKNEGNVSVSDVTIWENLPEGFIIFNYSNSTKWIRENNKFIYNGILDAGEEIELIITFNATIEGIFTNNITVSSNETSNLTINSTNNVTVYVPNMSVTKISNITVLDINNLINYTIIIENTGNTNISDIQVHESFLNGFKHVSNSANWTYDELTNMFTYTGSQLLIGETLILNITYNVTQNGTFENKINVTSNIGKTIQTSSDNVTVYAPNMTVIKSSNITGEIYIGDKINFTIKVTNTGDRNISNIKIIEKIPEELKYLSNSANWTYDEITNTFTYIGGNLTVGESLILNITFNTTKTGTFKNTIIVTSDTDNKTNSSEEITILPDIKLNITKTVNVTNANVGDLINYTIIVKNNGLSNATGVVVYDKLIDLLKFEYAIVSQGNYDNVTGLWNIDNITSNGEVSLTIFAKIIANGTISNVANVTSNENKTVINVTSDNVTANPIVDLVVVKSVNVTSVYVGDLVNFTITVTNVGLSNATGVNVTDILDKHLEFISFSSTRGDYDNVNGIWAIDNLNIGEVLTLNITARVLVNGTIPNMVSVTSNENDTNKSNNNASSTNITALPDIKLNITKTVNVTTANVGDLVNYTIVVKNNGLSNATGVVVYDKLTDSLKLDDAVVSQGNYNNVTGLWSIGNITSNMEVSLTIFARIIANGTISNIANVTSNENKTIINATSENITANPIIDLKVNKSVNVTSVYVGDLVNFTITVTNIGLSNATGVNVTDILDKRLEFISFSSTRGDYDNGIWAIGNLNVDEVLTLNITVRILANGTIANIASVVGNENDTNKSNNNKSSENITALPDVKLNITKTVNVTTANVGDLVNYTIVVKNNGLSNATDVVAYDKLNNHLEFLKFISSQGNYDNVSGLWSIGNITSGAEVSLTIFARIIANGTISNVANVTSNENKTVVNVTSDNVTANPVVDLVVVKSVNVTVVHVGDLVNFTITVTNIGLSNATGVNVTDILDKRLEFINFSATRGNYNNANGIWSIGNLNVEERLTLNITARILINGTIPNTVSVTSNENDTNKSNNNASSTNITALPDVRLNITKTVNVTTANVGDLVNYTIVVKNNGLSNATGVVVYDKLIDSLKLERIIVSQGNYDNVSGLWSIGNITSGAEVSLTIFVRIIANGTISNVANVTSNENKTVINVTSDNVTANPIIDLKVNKSVNVTSVYVGDLVNFTITVTNIGLSNATGVNVTDILDKRLEFISFSSTRGDYDNVKGIWAIGNLNVDEVLTLNITVRILANGTIANIVSVVGNENDTNKSNNNGSSENITALPDVKLNITKTVNTTNANVGDVINFTITVKNNGLSNATGVNVTDKLINLLEFIEFHSSQGNYDNVSGLWSIGNITSGAEVSLTIFARIIANGTISNIANATSNENKTIVNTTSGNVTVSPVVDLVISKSVNASRVYVGDLVNYTIVVTNVGLSNATGVNVTDILDKRLEFISFSSTKGDYDYANGIWSIGNLNVGEKLTLNITVRILVNGTIANIVSVVGNENDTNKSNNNGSSENITALPDVRLNITKTVNVTTANVGDLVNYTIVVKNNGLSNATGVVVYDKLIDSLKFENTVISQGNYDGVTGLWSIGNITSNGEVSLTIFVRIIANGTISNVANVTSNENKTVVNVTSDNVTASPVVDLVISKSVNASRVYVGDLVNYTIVVTNVGLSNATGVNVTDILDKRLEFISFSSTRGDYDYANGIWSVGNLNVDEVLTLNITARVLVNGTIPNTVSVTSNENDTNKSNNNGSSENITALPDVHLNITKTVNTTNANVGDVINFTITVKNNGLSNATNVKVTDKLINLLEFINSIPSKGIYDYETGLWIIDEITPNETVTLTIFAKIIANGTITNIANVTSTENTTVINTTSQNVTANPNIDLIINKTVNTTTVNVGDYVTYIITVKNIGLSNATGVIVTEILDKRLTLISEVENYDHINGKWTIGNLNANQTVSLTLVVKVTGNGTITNTVNVTSSEEDINKTNNVASSDNLTALPVVNITIIKKSNITEGGNVSVGDKINFTITITNHGPSNATNIVISDMLDDAFGFIEANGTYAGNKNIIWTITKLENGTSTSVWIIVEALKNGFFSNSAIVNSTENTNGSKNGTEVIILPAVNISLVKTSNVTSNANVGDLVNFTITITNHGPSKATNVNITDILTQGLQYISSGSNISGVTGVNNKNIIIWTISNLNNGESVKVWVTVKLLTNGTFTNTASVNSTENTTGTKNSTTINVNPIVNLTVTKTHNITENASIGDKVTFTITVKNNGPSNATNVTITDILNEAFQYISSNETCTIENQKITWFIGNLENNQSVSVDLTVLLLETGNFTNTATVNATENGTKTNGTTNITVKNRSTPIKLTTQNITYGDVETIIVTLPNDVTGTVNITVENREYNDLEIINGIVTLPIEDLAGGIYDVTVIYSGDSKYNGNSTKGTFKVSPKTPIINIEVVDIFVGQIEILNVTVNAPGTVNITVNGTTKEISLENGIITARLLMATRNYNGKSTWNILDLPVGNYPVFAIYNGNENYTSVNATATFNVKPLLTIIKITANDIKVGETAIINVEVQPNNATGNVTLTIEGKTYNINLTNGKGQIKINNLKAGSKQVYAKYNGDDKYLTSENTTIFNVKKQTPPINVKSQDIFVGEDETIIVTLPDDATGTVTIEIDGKKYTANVENGKAVFTIPNLKAGAYTVNANYSGDDKYLPVNGKDTFKVSKTKPDINVNSPDITVGEDGKITVTLPDDATGTVTIEIDGKKYTANVKNGKAIFIIPNLKIGLYKIKVWYSGDDKYLKTQTNTKLNVKPLNHTNSIKTNKNGSKHETGNPIILLLIGLLAIGVNLRKIKK